MHEITRKAFFDELEKLGGIEGMNKEALMGLKGLLTGLKAVGKTVKGGTQLAGRATGRAVTRGSQAVAGAVGKGVAGAQVVGKTIKGGVQAGAQRAGKAISQSTFGQYGRRFGNKAMAAVHRSGVQGGAGFASVGKATKFEQAAAGLKTQIKRKARVRNAAIRSGAKRSGEQIVAGTKATGQAIQRGATATGQAIVSGSQAVGRGVVTGTKATGQAIVSGSQAVGRGVVTGTKAVGAGLQQAGTKIRSGWQSASKKVKDVKKNMAASSKKRRAAANKDIAGKDAVPNVSAVKGKTTKTTKDVPKDTKGTGTGTTEVPKDSPGFVQNIGGAVAGKGATEGTKTLAGLGTIGGGAWLASNIFGKKDSNGGIIIKGASYKFKKHANTNVAGKGGTDVKVTAPKANIDLTTTPKPKKAQQKMPKLSNFNFSPIMEKESAIMSHIVKAVSGVGKSVGKAVKGGVRANKKSKVTLHRGNIGKKLLENPTATGAATLAAGAYGTKKILE